MKIYKNNQEVFDIIWHKFVVNKQPRNISGARCVYEHPGCFIGCLLTARDARMLDNRKDKQGQYYTISIRAILQPYAFEEKKEKVEMNTMDKDGEEGAKTFVSAGSDMSKGHSKGQAKANYSEEAKNEKETAEAIAKAIQLPERFENQKAMLKFILMNVVR